VRHTWSKNECFRKNPMTRRLVRVGFPCAYVISERWLPHSVHVRVSLDFLRVLAFTCLTWTDCDLLTSSPADIGSRDHQALSKPAGVPEGTLMSNIRAHLHYSGKLSAKLLMASFFSLLLRLLQ